MVCDCCNRRKKLLESYALIQSKETSINLCSSCNDAFYKLRDAANAGSKEQFKDCTEIIDSKEKKPSKDYQLWKTMYVKAQKDRLKQVIEAKKNK